MPQDKGPRAAIEAAWEFIDGAKRTWLQRMASLGAHRAAAETSTEATRLAARCGRVAPSTAYLHPIAQAGKAGPIVRAPAPALRSSAAGNHTTCSLPANVDDERTST